MNNINNKGMENGYVVLPAEKYAELLITAERLNRLITVRKSYGDTVVAELNKRTMYELAKKAFEASQFNTPEYEFKDFDNTTFYSADIATKITTEEDE